MKRVDVINSGTFWTMPTEGGAFYGEAKGTFTTPGEIVTYTAQGVGRPIYKNTILFTGSNFLYALPDRKFSHLNNTVSVVEVEVDTNTGDITGKTFELK